MSKKLLIALLFSLSTNSLLIGAGHKDSIDPELVRASRTAESQKAFVKRLSEGRSRLSTTPPITPPRRKSKTPSPFGSPDRLTLQEYELRSRSTSPQRKKGGTRLTPPDSKASSPNTSASSDVSSETISLLSFPKRRLRTPSPLVQITEQTRTPSPSVQTKEPILRSYLLKEYAKAKTSTPLLPVATPKATNPQQDTAEELLEMNKRAPRIGLKPLERRSLSNSVGSFGRIPEKIRKKVLRASDTFPSSAFQPSTLSTPVEEKVKPRSMFNYSTPRNLAPRSMFDISQPKPESSSLGTFTVLGEEDEPNSDEKEYSHMLVDHQKQHREKTAQEMKANKQCILNEHNATWKNLSSEVRPSRFAENPASETKEYYISPAEKAYKLSKVELTPHHQIKQEIEELHNTLKQEIEKLKKQRVSKPRNDKLKELRRLLETNF